NLPPALRASLVIAARLRVLILIVALALLLLPLASPQSKNGYDQKTQISPASLAQSRVTRQPTAKVVPLPVRLRQFPPPQAVIPERLLAFVLSFAIFSQRRRLYCLPHQASSWSSQEGHRTFRIRS